MSVIGGISLSKPPLATAFLLAGIGLALGWLLPLGVLSLAVWLGLEVILLAFFALLLSVLVGKGWARQDNSHKVALVIALVGTALFVVVGDAAFFSGRTWAAVSLHLGAWAFAASLALAGALLMAYAPLRNEGREEWSKGFLLATILSLALTLPVFLRMV